jgi:uncharacterized protein YvpB
MFNPAPKRLIARPVLFGAVFLWALGAAVAAYASAAPGVWLDVPFIKQPAEGCGAASIAMVMQYWSNQQGKSAGANAEVATIQGALYSREAHGIYASALENYLKQHGFQAFSFSGTWDNLKQHLEKGRPLIVGLRPSGPGQPLHYVVVVGLNWDEGVVLLNDPADRKLLKQERVSFEKEWSAVNKWTLLAVPRH